MRAHEARRGGAGVCERRACARDEEDKEMGTLASGVTLCRAEPSRACR